MADAPIRFFIRIEPDFLFADLVSERLAKVMARAISLRTMVSTDQKWDFREVFVCANSHTKKDTKGCKAEIWWFHPQERSKMHPKFEFYSLLFESSRILPLTSKTSGVRKSILR